MKKNFCLFTVLLLLAGSLYCQEEESEIESLILAYNSGSNDDVTFLRKINIGISGGDNWLVELTSNNPRENSILLLYIINNGIIIKEINMGPNYNVSEETDFDIMKDIPGMQIGKGSSVIHDFNGDGFDDIFKYAFSGRGAHVLIMGHDLDKRTRAFYAEIPFQVIDREKGPAPVEFVTYKGMKGFKVYYFVGEVGGGPGFIPNPSPKNHRWFFYAWDERQREFVEIEEFVEDWEESYIEPSQPILAEQSADEFELAEDSGVQEEASAFALVGSGKKSGFNLYIAITAGIAVLAAVAVFIIVKRKKK